MAANDTPRTCLRTRLPHEGLQFWWVDGVASINLLGVSRKNHQTPSDIPGCSWQLVTRKKRPGYKPCLEDLQTDLRGWLVDCIFNPNYLLTTVSYQIPRLYISSSWVFGDLSLIHTKKDSVVCLSRDKNPCDIRWYWLASWDPYSGL